MFFSAVGIIVFNLNNEQRQHFVIISPTSACLIASHNCSIPYITNNSLRTNGTVLKECQKVGVTFDNIQCDEAENTFIT